MDERALTRLAYDVYKDDEAYYDIANSYTLPGCTLTADDVLRLSSKLHADYGNNIYWTISQRIYNKIRWWRHCERAYGVSPRKVRKCVMRRTQRRRKRERRRYL